MLPEELNAHYYLTVKYYVEQNGETVDFEIESRSGVFTFQKWDNIISAPTESMLLAYNINDVLAPLRMVELRTERNSLLLNSDFYMLTDSPITSIQKTTMATYRQSLRNLPSTVDLTNIIYPVKPF
jgi:hypothetical protein